MKFKLRIKILAGGFLAIMVFCVFSSLAFAMDPPLIVSARDGNFEEVRRLVAEGENVNCKDQHGATPLSFAVGMCRMDVAAFLIENGADVNCGYNGYKFGETPLHLAAKKGYLGIAELLIKSSANVNCIYLTSSEMDVMLPCVNFDVDDDGFSEPLDDFLQVTGTPLYIAVDRGYQEMVKLLIDHGAYVNNDRDKRSVVGDLVLHDAPLYEAVQGGHLEVAKLLIGNGADVNHKRKCESSPLHIAVEKGDLEMIKLLLDHGADVNFKSSERYYGVICRYGNLHVDKSPLYVAIEKGDLEAVKLLIKYRANINCENVEGNTPLHLAAEKGALEIAGLLIDKGANVDYKNKREETPLHAAAKNGKLAVAELLIKRGADINSRCKTGKTPLWFARASKYDVARMLLGYGAIE